MTALRSSGRRRSRVVLCTVAVVVLGLGVAPVGAVSSALTERVNVSSTGDQANGKGYGSPSISADGQFVAFTSYASNLVDDDTNGEPDVFVYDRATQQTERVSVSSTGLQGNDGSYGSPSVSADGRFVAFSSRASNLVRADTNRRTDVFVYDRTTQQTRRISVSSTGTQARGDSGDPSISADGRFVAFASSATNLAQGDTDWHEDVFVRDRATHRTQVISVSRTGNKRSHNSRSPSISADGRYVAFVSHDPLQVKGDSNHTWDVFVHDRSTHLTRRVSVTSTGAQATAKSKSPSISANGRYVAFASFARLTEADTGWGVDVYVRDLATHQTRGVSVSSTENDVRPHPKISAHGRFVAFRSGANLVDADTNTASDVFVRDRVTHQTRRVSVSSTGTQANGRSGDPAISADARFVAFISAASNLVADDTNSTRDLFVRGPLR